MNGLEFSRPTFCLSLFSFALVTTLFPSSPTHIFVSLLDWCFLFFSYMSLNLWNSPHFLLNTRFVLLGNNFLVIVFFFFFLWLLGVSEGPSDPYSKVGMWKQMERLGADIRQRMSHEYTIWKIRAMYPGNWVLCNSSARDCVNECENLSLWRRIHMHWGGLTFGAVVSSATWGTGYGSLDLRYDPGCAGSKHFAMGLRWDKVGRNINNKSILNV